MKWTDASYCWPSTSGFQSALACLEAEQHPVQYSQIHQFIVGFVVIQFYLLYFASTRCSCMSLPALMASFTKDIHFVKNAMWPSHYGYCSVVLELLAYGERIHNVYGMVLLPVWWKPI